jgi:hypothetical protein
LRLVVAKELVVAVVEHRSLGGNGVRRVLESPNLLSVLLGLLEVTSLLPLECVLLVGGRSTGGGESSAATS